MMKQNLTRSKLRDAVDRADDAADSAAAATIRSLRKFLRNYVNGFRSAALDFVLDEREIVSLAEQQQLVRLAEELLEEAGYGDFVETYRRGLSKVEANALSYFERFAENVPQYSGVAREAVELLAEDFVEQLDLEIDRRLVKPLQAQIRQTTLSVQDRRQAVTEISRFIQTSGVVRRDGRNFSMYNVETLVAESGRRFQEVIRATQAAELGLTVFIYSGPNDKVTRPGCRYLLDNGNHGAPGFWYGDEIKVGMHPELKENPRTARGGYNCRHQWMPVDEAAAMRLDPSFRPRRKVEEREAA